MRIIAGTHRGRPLTAVGKGDAAAHLRPTSDRVREALFSMLEGGRLGPGVAECQVLDLFAGTGALGLEALSRGAAFCTFVDTGRTSLRLLHSNIATLDLGAVTQVIKADARALPDAPGAACDLVFLDPPYGKDLGAAALMRARSRGWIAPDALIVWEERQAQPPPEGFDLIDSRRYGDTQMTFLRATS